MEANRVEEGTEVINKSNFLDLTVNYGITNRIYANLTLPYAHNTRSSMYEHGGNPPTGLGDRHETGSQGLADIRFGLGYWLLDPSTAKTNVAVGIGVKLPTGSYKVTDIFYNQGPLKNEQKEGYVDQSIQLGDGGTGITLDFQAYQYISKHLSASAGAFYMSNPRETNGVFLRNSTTNWYSCPDQYGARIGLSYFASHGINAYLGGRAEGVPSSDIIGGSVGFRRPGYAISAEPGLGYTHHRVSFNFSLPIALVRARVQNYDDKLSTTTTGVYKIGDAAFADYLINVNVAYRFGGKHHDMNTESK